MFIYFINIFYLLNVYLNIYVYHICLSLSLSLYIYIYIYIYINIYIYIMHLADAFIQSDLHCIQVTVLHIYIYILYIYNLKANLWIIYN